MSPPDPAPDADALLAHVEGLRRLAFALVRRDDEVDDAVQSTLAAALAPGRGPVRALGPWLREVLRRTLGKQGRGAVRRRRRERVAAERAAAGPAPATDEALARHETRQRALEAVRRLAEPYRYAILLRYFEGLPPAAIAKRQGVALGTVKSWLKRGLERLRTDLDARHEGERERWHVALLPLAHALPSAGTPLLLLGGLAVKKTLWSAVALALLALGGSAWLLSPSARPRAPQGRQTLALAPDRPPVLEGREQGASPTPSPTPEAEAPAPPGPEVEGGVAVAGRVVAAGRHPVAGAAVVASMGAERFGTRTDAAGRFRVPLGARPAAWTGLVVWVRGAPGVATIPALAGPGSPALIDVGVVRVERPVRLAVRVEQGGAPASGARVWLLRFSESQMLPPLVAAGVADPRGRFTVENLAPGVYRALALAPGAGRAAALVTLGAAAEEVVLRLPAPHAMRVRVLDRESGAPVAGARLQVKELIPHPPMAVVMDYVPTPEPAPTDAGGWTELGGLSPEDRLQLLALAPGYPPPTDLVLVYGLEPGLSETELRLQRLTSISFAVEPGDGEIPADGTPVTLVRPTMSRTRVPPSAARLERGRLVLEGVEGARGVDLLAEVPDGRRARVPGGRGAGRESTVRFEAQRWILVRVRRPDGSPAAGVWLEPREHPQQAGLCTPVPTDPEGRARVGPLFPGVVHVVAGFQPDLWSGRVLGQVDVARGDAPLEATLEAEQRVRLTLLSGGQAALPSEYRLTWRGLDWVASGRSVEEDPERGTLTLALPLPPPGEPAGQLVVEAPGRQTASVAVPMRSGLVDLRLELAAAASVRSVLRASAAAVRAGQLQRLEETSQRWLPVARDPGTRDERREFAGGAVEVRRLSATQPPGRFRLVDPATGATSAEVHAEAGGEPQEVVLDLSQEGFARGRIDLPAGYAVSDARVGCGVPDDVRWLYPGAGSSAVEADGTFALRIPGDRPVRLRVTHPLLLADPVEGVVELTRPREGLLLRLVAGAEATLRLTGAPQRPAADALGAPSAPRVLIFPGEPQGEPVSEHALVDAGAGLRFGGFRPGTYTLWLDLGTGAPLVVHGVTLGPRHTDLGTLAFDPGGALRVRLRLPAGRATPGGMVAVEVVGAAEPRATRRAYAQDALELRVEGLGRGRHRVVVQAPATGGGPAPVEREVDLTGDGVTTVEIDVP